MSIDAKIENICDHRIHEEQLEIDSDLRTIRISRTLASKNVTLFINGFKTPSDHVLFGWTIQNDEQAVYTQRSKLVFNNKRKSKDDFYTLSYSSIRKFCPKCKGLSIHNDLEYSSLGNLRIVKNEEKLLQEVKKGIATELSSNQFHKWIGTMIYTLVGSKVFNADSLRGKAIEEVTRYLERYISVQIQQSNYQEVTDREAFGQILSVNMDPDIDDPTYWTLTIIFNNRTGSDMIYEKKLDIPGPKNLLSDSF